MPAADERPPSPYAVFDYGRATNIEDVILLEETSSTSYRCAATSPCYICRNIDEYNRVYPWIYQYLRAEQYIHRFNILPLPRHDDYIPASPSQSPAERVNRPTIMPHITSTTFEPEEFFQVLDDDYVDDDYEPNEDFDEDDDNPRLTEEAENRLRVWNYSYTPNPLKFVELHEGELTSTYQPDPTVPYLGYELETDNNRHDITEGLRIVHAGMDDYVYCKSDGSINGFEIVSVPMTLEAHQNFDLEWMKNLARYGYRSWNSYGASSMHDRGGLLSAGGQCGIHIHISKSVFESPKHNLPLEPEESTILVPGFNAPNWMRRATIRAQLDTLGSREERLVRSQERIYNRRRGMVRRLDHQYYADYQRVIDQIREVRNQIDTLSDEMSRSRTVRVRNNRTQPNGTAHIWRFAQLIMGNAGRSQNLAGRNNNYAEFTHLNQVKDFIVGKAGYQGRGAVNLQTHSGNTIEVRMFRGSLKPERLLADLEFVQAAYEYTKPLRMKDVKTGALQWGNFTDFVCDPSAHQHDFSHLAEYMQRLQKGDNILLEETAS